SPLRCACELAEKIEKDATFRVRMGIHTGEVTRLLDINRTANVSGDGINIAQRVMDFGDGGHILMSLEHATRLQEARDPAANECYDIGVATAKHGKRVHLFNFHRPAVGTPEVPVKVRKDDEWIRPKTLRLGTSGHNIVFAAVQILGWLFVSPLKWRTHVNQIDPRLTPNFSVIDLTWPQIRRNRDLRELLIQVYLICPAMLSLLIWAVLTPVAAALGIHVIWCIGEMWAMGLLVSVLLGVGAALVGFVLLAFQMVVQTPALGWFGPASAANQIAVSAVCVWAALALSAIFPARRPYSALREISGALLSSFIVTAIWITVLALGAKRPPLIVGAIMAVTAFILINVVTGLRWQRWSRGFVFGQVLGVIAGAGYISIMGSTGMGPVRLLEDGLVNGLGDAVLWATAFAIAEKIAGARAAVIGGLMMTVCMNMTLTWWSLLPLIALWTTYAVIRRRSLARAHAAAAASAVA
ncbi:MAG: hypothetical protein ACRD9W_06025, partial [Terriglobia bacterium]